MCNKTRMNLDSLSRIGFIVVFVWPHHADLLFCHWNRKEVLLLVLGASMVWKNKSCSQCFLIAHQSLGASHHQLTSLTYPLINSLANLVYVLLLEWIAGAGVGAPCLAALCSYGFAASGVVQWLSSCLATLQQAAGCWGWMYLRKSNIDWLIQYFCLPGSWDAKCSLPQRLPLVAYYPKMIKNVER